MKCLLRSSTLVAVLCLIAVVAHADPKNPQPRGPQGCTPTDSASFQAPSPACDSTLHATVGAPLTFTVQAGDDDQGDVVELAVTGLPAGAQLSTPLPASGNPVSTNFSWTPAPGDTGSRVITFSANDGCATGPTLCSFTLSVSPAAGACSPANAALFHAPTPTCGSTLNATVGTHFTFSVHTSDADGDSVELAVSGLPAGAQLSTPLPATGIAVATDVTWTPAASDTGSHVITFTATDGCAEAPTQCAFTVHVGPAGGDCSPTNAALFHSPTPTCGSTLNATVGAPFTLSVHTSDADGDSVELAVSGLPAGAQLSTPLPATGIAVATDLTWTPAAADTGAHVITFTAHDGCAAPTQCSFTVQVSPAGGACSPANAALFQPPTPTCGSTRQTGVGALHTFTVQAGDADAGDTVVLDVTGLPPGAQLSTPLPASGNPVSTNFSWTPAAGDTGAHVITFTAFDSCASAPTTCSITIQVGSGGGGSSNPPNCSAAYVADSEIWPPNGRMVPVNIQGIADPEGDPFTVHVTSITTDEAISSDGSCDARVDENGNASVRARRSGSGNGRVYHVTFLATDANGASCEGSVDLCVPHDRGRNSECVDDGQNFHVTGACVGDDDGDDAAGKGKGKKEEIDLKVTQLSSGVAQVEYTLPAEAQMSLAVYNVAGRRVATIVEGRQPAGTRSVQWSATSRVPAVYFVQMRSGDQSVARRIFFLNR